METYRTIQLHREERIHIQRVLLTYVQNNKSTKNRTKKRHVRHILATLGLSHLHHNRQTQIQHQPPQPVELLRAENHAPAPTSPRDCCWRSLACLPTPTSSSMLGPPCHFFVVALHTLPLLHSLPSTARLVGSYHC